MINAANDQVEAAAPVSEGKAAWTTPQVARLNVEEAAAGDSVSSADASTFAS